MFDEIWYRCTEIDEDVHAHLLKAFGTRSGLHPVWQEAGSLQGEVGDRRESLSADIGRSAGSPLARDAVTFQPMNPPHR